MIQRTMLLPTCSHRPPPSWLLAEKTYSHPCSIKQPQFWVTREFLPIVLPHPSWPCSNLKFLRYKVTRLDRPSGERRVLAQFISSEFSLHQSSWAPLPLPPGPRALDTSLWAARGSVRPPLGLTPCSASPWFLGFRCEQAQSRSLVLPWISSPAALGFADPGKAQKTSPWPLAAWERLACGSCQLTLRRGARSPSLECQQQESLETFNGQRSEWDLPACRPLWAGWQLDGSSVFWSVKEQSWGPRVLL